MSTFSSTIHIPQLFSQEKYLYTRSSYCCRSSHLWKRVLSGRWNHLFLLLYI